MDTIQHELFIPPELAGKRLDQALAKLLPDYSRERLKSWIRAQEVVLNDRHPRPRDAVAAGDIVRVNATLQQEIPLHAQPMALEVVYEDDAIIIINKPAGLVVHPGAGNPDGTLQNGLLAHDSGLIHVPRAGIVHRLDKDTSGLLVIARTLVAHTALVAALAERTVKRQYKAVVVGTMTAGGTVDAPIGRHRVNRKRMAVQPNGRPAVTHYRVAARYRAHTFIDVQLETGRTHQIRVHMAHQRYPLVGDPVYGRRLVVPKAASEHVLTTLRGFKRQALHAAKLGLTHPVTGEYQEFIAPMPQDMQQLTETLEKDTADHASD